MEWMPPREYYARRPKIITGAAAFFCDHQGRVLLVKPGYKPGWELPGGGTDPGEYPWETARREVMEETGLELRPVRLLAVDWVSGQDDGRPPMANFVFDGGILTAAQRMVRVRDDEIEQWKMAAPAEWDRLLTSRMARRVRACAQALATGSTAYLQHGWPLASPGQTG
jgi:8-oxo-dGTP pyrophosphatase MutT (NUDIX family)